MVLDFGVAAALRTEPAARMTTPGFALGTPAYAPREQGLGFRRTVVDVYALGGAVRDAVRHDAVRGGRSARDHLCEGEESRAVDRDARRSAAAARRARRRVSGSSFASRPADMLTCGRGSMRSCARAQRRYGPACVQAANRRGATLVAAFSWAAVTVAPIAAGTGDAGGCLRERTGRLDLHRPLRARRDRDRPCDGGRRSQPVPPTVRPRQGRSPRVSMLGSACGRALGPPGARLTGVTGNVAARRAGVHLERRRLRVRRPRAGASRSIELGQARATRSCASPSICAEPDSRGVEGSTHQPMFGVARLAEEVDVGDLDNGTPASPRRRATPGDRQ